jgi:hypothetical protein
VRRRASIAILAAIAGVLRSIMADRSASYIASNISSLSTMAYGTALVASSRRLQVPIPSHCSDVKIKPHGYHPPIILPQSMSLATNTIIVPVSFVFLSKPFHHVVHIQQQRQQQQQHHLPHHVWGSHARATLHGR